jgi:FkbM family methyltransferase
MLINLDGLVTKYNLKISGIIQIGANRGQEIEHFYGLGINNIVAFEPLPENYHILCHRFPQLKAHKVALGNDMSMVTMNVSNNQQQSSSILTPKVHLSHHPDVHFTSQEQVVMSKLDMFSADTVGKNLIMMDVQGYELEVLKGATETLKNIDYLMCEVNRAEVYENNAYIGQIDEFLAEYGMRRVETDWAGVIWGDAFYIKEK